MMKELTEALNRLPLLKKALVCVRDLGAPPVSSKIGPVLEEIGVEMFRAQPQGGKVPRTFSRDRVQDMALSVWLEWAGGTQWPQAKRAEKCGLSKRQFQRSYTDQYQTILGRLDDLYSEAIDDLHNHIDFRRYVRDFCDSYEVTWH